MEFLDFLQWDYCKEILENRMEQECMEILLSSFTENIADDQEDQDFSQNNNVVPKK